ncbi:hypothetical protein HPMG_01620 [Helicobacter pullorum MIT 98-5489]|uniref:Uncharacterized protein n=1 Tax=Helicobacter pullorum MIT 98-5489 TaxID=537972 RepID=C5F1K8_9HELI|nr:hypothetical protein [Helicobacter pullorum]EEQ64163.1 hypothetical protein HPMG_01620 [Helicobacter pullorum MIT 98-5489]
MNFLENIDYRDPLFGIMIFIFLVGIISLFAYYWNYIVSKKRHQSFIKFMESFDYIGFDKEIKEFLALSPNPTPSILFMANMYQKGANYEKAIRLYATLLDYIKNPIDKIPILESLGNVYYKAGFPLRSKEIYLEILHHYPRSCKVLKSLISIYEELKLYQDALNALDCLEEIEGGTILHRHYLQTKILISNADNNQEKSKKLLMLLQKDVKLSRIILKYFKDFYPSLFWESIQNLHKEQILNVLDILWNLNPNELPNTPPNNKLLQDIFQAKGFYNLTPDSKSTFELEVLTLLHKNQNYKGDLKFQYLCTSCKANTPLPFETCPHCKELLTLQTLVFLKEKQDETRYSLL